MATIESIRTGATFTFFEKLSLLARLSFPAILAQLSSIVMQYIDASMVGSLGANASASIGLVSTTLWLFWGVCSSSCVGFSVQVAHHLGANDAASARNVLRQSLVCAFLFGLVMALIGVAIGPSLPHWLGGDPAICDDASTYFLIFVSGLPLLTFHYLGSGMLRAAGNMKVAGAVGVGMCALDVIFNVLLIFPTRPIAILGLAFTVPGAGLGVVGAALGTVLAELTALLVLMWYLCFRSSELRLWGRRGGSFRPTRRMISKWFHIAWPLTLEHAVFCMAQIVSTIIVAPLGIASIAANSFGVTAESLCYMPGYGISEAVTTLVGQSYGARRQQLMKQFAYVGVGFGMVVMAAMGLIMYVAAPEMMAMLSPVEEIRQLGVEALRIEAWAEPLYGASIVAYGAFVGAADTLVPVIINFSSIWLVRLTLAAVLAPTMGLAGVWLAMCIELCVRGLLFLLRLPRLGRIKLKESL